MPEYLAPGVYVEETTFRQKSIEGVSTSTAGFVGPTRFGPTSGEPELLTSFLDFERIYGGLDQLFYEQVSHHNDLAHAVRGFFENGGRRLYVARAFTPSREPSADPAAALEDRFPDHGCCVLSGTPSHPVVSLRARWPGLAGNAVVTVEVRVGPNILVRPGDGDPPTLSGALRWDTVLVRSVTSPPVEPELAVVDRAFDDASQQEVNVLLRGGTPTSLAQIVGDGADEVRVVTVTVTVGRLGRFMDDQVWENLNPDPRHRTASLVRTFAAEPQDRATALHVPLVLDAATLDDGAALLDALLGGVPVTSSPPVASVAELIEQAQLPATAGATPARVRCRLDGGSDGIRPDATAYAGDESADGAKSGLLAFEDLEDISIVATPGSSRGGLDRFATASEATVQALVSHAERMRYRIAVVDSPDGALVSDVRRYRAQFDSKHAALYYPWITIADPVTESEITTPPSGFLAGVYARNDIERGVHKAPANEVVRLAVDFELPINKGQQDVLNPEGVNCLRFFEGRGYRVWGARTISSDPEWKYVNLRRYFAFVERSIDKGTQWAVFEPNGTALWSNVRRTVEDFLFAEWRSGHLLGDTVAEAFFVRCDRTTMTQNDLDNGRLICLVGIAPLRPAEFVVFRIGQKTLDVTG
ncbi:phage tail sheath family protein [Geodermatophilus sp. SYSU D00804]